MYRRYEDDWGERYQGLLIRDPVTGSDNYEAEANQSMAQNLQGKLLLAHGTLDGNVPPENTLIVVDALIKANKDFDLLMIPNAGTPPPPPYEFLFWVPLGYIYRTSKWDIYSIQTVLQATASAMLPTI